MTGLVGFVGARASPRRRDSPTMRWYASLEKPPFQPPPWVFGPVWSLLYALVAASGWQVYEGASGKARQRALALWAAQMGLNGLWTWLFFAKRRPRAALLDCALLLAVATAYAGEASKANAKASRLVFPYLGWLGFATALNAEIVRRNPDVLEASEGA